MTGKRGRRRRKLLDDLKEMRKEVKVKCTLVQALRLCTGRTAHRGSRDIALTFLDHALEGGEGSASRPDLFLPPGKTLYPLYRRLDRPQGGSGQVRKISPPQGFDSRTVQPVASRYIEYATQPTKVSRGYSHLKEDALDRTVWRARYGRGFGPALRQTAE